MKYYNNVTENREEKDDFEMLDIALRVENNFLQGLYFDSSERVFYESAGLYGKSHVQSLKVKNPETMRLVNE